MKQRGKLNIILIENDKYDVFFKEEAGYFH